MRPTCNFGNSRSFADTIRCKFWTRSRGLFQLANYPRTPHADGCGPLCLGACADVELRGQSWTRTPGSNKECPEVPTKIKVKVFGFGRHGRLQWTTPMRNNLKFRCPKSHVDSIIGSSSNPPHPWPHEIVVAVQWCQMASDGANGRSKLNPRYCMVNHQLFNGEIAMVYYLIQIYNDLYHIYTDLYNI